jgi:hypothetical protein
MTRRQDGRQDIIIKASQVKTQCKGSTYAPDKSSNVFIIYRQNQLLQKLFSNCEQEKKQMIAELFKFVSRILIMEGASFN